MPANPTARENSTEAEVVAELRGAPDRPLAPSDYFSLVRKAAALIESQRATIEADDARAYRLANSVGRLSLKLDAAEARVTALEAEKAAADKRVDLLEGGLHLLRRAVEADDPKRELLLRIDDALALAQPSTQGNDNGR